MNTNATRMRNVMLLGLAAYAGAAIAYDSDGTGEYVTDASGTKHYLLFMNSSTGIVKDGGRYSYDRSDAAAAAGNLTWQANSVWTFEKDASYHSRMEDNSTHDVYGLLFETGAFTSSCFWTSEQKFNIGAFGIRSDVGGIELGFYANSSGAKRLNLTESQTWSGPDAATLSSSAFRIAVNRMYSAKNTNNVYAADGVVLTLKGNLLVNMFTFSQNLQNADVVVKSPATISLNQSTVYPDSGIGRLNAHSLTIDGGSGLRFGKDTSITFSGAQGCTYGHVGSYPLISPMQVAPTIVLTNGATLTALAETSITGGVTVVSAGAATNFLSGTFRLDDDRTTFRVESGATLDLTDATFKGAGRYAISGAGTVVMDAASAASSFIGADGFTGTICASPDLFLVTDSALEGEVAVADGETLHVFGDGLGASALVSLGNGASLVFHRTVMVAAAISSVGNASFATVHHSVTGTLAGVYTASPLSANTSFHIYIDSPGLLVFSGGGVLGRDDTDWDGATVHMRSGKAAITGRFDVYASLFMEGGRLTVRDGGEWRVLKQWQNVRLDKNASADTCLEVGTGGMVSNAVSNCSLILGGTAHESRLLVNGGEYWHRFDAITVKDNAVIEVASGLLNARRTMSLSGHSRLVLGDGTINVGHPTYGKILFAGDGFCAVDVEGKATLRIVDGAATFLDSTNKTANCSWTCVGDAFLKVIGRDYAATTFVMRNYAADGLTFDLNTDDFNDQTVNVVVDSAGDALSIGFLLPGKVGNCFTATNRTPTVDVSFVVPSGVTYDVNESYVDSLFIGFSALAVSNLTFGAGSTLAFPFFSSPYLDCSITGTLNLPEAMNYRVSSVGVKEAVPATAVLSPALGVVDPLGCIWTCTGGVNAKCATLTVEEGAVKFAYAPPGIVVTIR